MVEDRISRGQSNSHEQVQAFVHKKSVIRINVWDTISVGKYTPSMKDGEKMNGLLNIKISTIHSP